MRVESRDEYVASVQRIGKSPLWRLPREPRKPGGRTEGQYQHFLNHRPSEESPRGE